MVERLSVFQAAGEKRTETCGKNSCEKRDFQKSRKQTLYTKSLLLFKICQTTYKGRKETLRLWSMNLISTLRLQET